MAEFFGTLERIAADLYPWRWPILAAILVLGAAATYYAYRREIHLTLWKRRKLTAIIATPFLIVFGFLAWGLGSPLFINETVEEEFPFAYTAVVPEGMEMEDIEMAMAVVAAMDDEPMMEAMPEMMMEEEETGEAVKLKEGNFRDADSFHRGSGQAIIYRAPDGSHLLRLENLNVTNGPRLHVLLAVHEDPMEVSEIKDNGYHDLGRLKGNIGNQNYEIPADVNVDSQMSVIIYCKPFSVIFSVAPFMN